MNVLHVCAVMVNSNNTLHPQDDEAGIFTILAVAYCYTVCCQILAYEYHYAAFVMSGRQLREMVRI